VGGGTIGQHGDLLLSARFTQRVQQAGHAAQVVEGDVSGGPVNGTVVSGAQAAEDVDQPGSSAKVSAGSCCFILNLRRRVAQKGS
jgi:hypothetical protein